MTTPVDEPVEVPEQSGPGGLVAVGGADRPAVRLRLRVAYDGTAFSGWARQPGLRSVQAEFESALRTVLRMPDDVPVRVAVAGRTDAGVHAIGQVCHCDVPAEVWSALSARDGAPREVIAARRLNGVLAADLRVLSLDLAPTGFDARWSAAWRRYSYLVADGAAAQDPRARGHVLWNPRELDVPAMDAAAKPFAGEHDFAAFCRAREGASSVRTVHEIGWSRRPSEMGIAGAVEFCVRADAFCHSMVRSLVGAFLAVGEGRWPVERPAVLLGAGERVPGITTAPAHGLTLVEVGYPPDADVAAQAQRAKRWRGR